METQEQILNSNLNKTQKAKKLFDLGLTKRQVADLLMNGNIGFACNVWKKWNEDQSSSVISLPFEFAFVRTFGVEIEYYGVSRESVMYQLQLVGIDVSIENYNHTTRRYWKIVTDSSITGNSGGELVSPVLRGREGIDELKRVCIALKCAGAKINKSCGLHIHIGVGDLTLDNFKNLYKNYINLETEIDSMMPNSRRNNNNRYCKKIISIGYGKQDTINKINSASTLGEFKDLFCNRYLKLNFCSYQMYGTVEFRHHSGSIKYSTIKNWIMICARMVEFAKQNRIANSLNDFTNEFLQEYIEDRKIDLSA